MHVQPIPSRPAGSTLTPFARRARRWRPGSRAGPAGRPGPGWETPPAAPPRPAGGT